MRLKHIIPCLIGVALVLSADLSQAEDLGKYGNVWDIQEQDAIDTIKGKLTKKVTAVGPKCPAGYKKK